MTRVASLGMYDATDVQPANDCLWTRIAERLVDHGLDGVPTALDRDRPLDAVWSDPGLLLAQSCGYPLVTRFRDRLRYVATPRYAVAGCVGASYRSRIVVRQRDGAERLADLRGRRAAVNTWDSNSGMNLFRATLAPIAGGRPFFAAVLSTGSHAASLRAVAEGEADIAAIDVVSFAHLARGDPALAGSIRTIAWTDPSPGLPFVTSAGTDDATVRLLRRVLEEVGRCSRTRAAREALLLEGFECLPAGRYDTLLRVEREAARLRYPELA